MNTRYPRIREAYAGTTLVHALDRVDGLARSAHAGAVIHLVLVPYLDILEAALREKGETADAAGSCLDGALDAVNQALEAYGLLDAEPTRLLN